MKKSRIIAAAAGAALVAGLVGAPGAQAADDTTTVTFTIASGGIAISVVDDADPLVSGGTALARTASGDVGVVTVTDSDADLTGWNVSASMTDPFSDGGGTPKTIPCTTATVTTSLLASSSTGTVAYAGLAAPGALTLNADTAGDADDCAPKVIGNATGAVGANSATFTTSVSIAIPTTALAATYSGVIVQTAL